MRMEVGGVYSLGVGGVEFAQSDLASHDLLGVVEVVLHPFPGQGADERREVHVADHRNQGFEAAVVNQTDEVGWQGAVENHGLRTLACGAATNHLLQGIVIGIACQGPAVELVEPFRMLLQSEAEHFAVHSRPYVFALRTEMRCSLVNHEAVFDQLGRHQGQLSHEAFAVDAELQAVFILEVLADVSVETCQLLHRWLQG